MLLTPPPPLPNSSVDRVISLGNGLPAIPERLLIAHARGEVLFIVGAGVSMSPPASLPDFKTLLIGVYAALDGAVHAVISKPPPEPGGPLDLSALSYQQAAEVQRFFKSEYDVVLGMLERRMDRRAGSGSRVRAEIANLLRGTSGKPSLMHRALMKLADRGGVVTIGTTNFDLLLQAAISRKTKPKPPTYALGGIPRPGRSIDFAGVLHIHGALERDPARLSDFVVTDHDFGEFYMRRRTVPDFIYDAARLFNLVLVGYSANDPPMRYLLNAVAADGVRFDDLKERFTFTGHRVPDPIAAEDWKGRGITPIVYDSNGNHSVLLQTLERWAELSAVNGNPKAVDAEIRRIVKHGRSTASDSDRDLFDHLIRRSDSAGRVRLAALASTAGADLGWLDAIVAVTTEKSLRIER